MAEGVFYIDESAYTNGRYRSVAAISIESHHPIIEDALQDALAKCRHDDFKWERLANGDHVRAAIEALDLILPLVQRGFARIDVLVWDVWDSRHSVPGRNDIENLAAMHWHLLTDVVGKRWPNKSNWKGHADQQNGILYTKLRESVESGASAKAQLPAGEQIRISEIVEVHSEDEPFIQLADLFAGIGQYSCDHAKTFAPYWAMLDEELKALYEAKRPPFSSNRDRARFRVLRHLVTRSQGLGLPLAAHKEDGLATSRATATLRFWKYQPQGDYDKAPGSRLRAQQDAANQTYELQCSHPGCQEKVTLEFRVSRPFCKRHYAMSMQQREARETELHDEWKAGQPTHYCEGCFSQERPSAEAIAKANYIGAAPKCSSCGARLTALGPQSEVRDVDWLVEDFELRRKRY